jgi:DNA-binding response OmpR family regulator
MLKILLADDDYTMVALLKTLLSMEGYQVATLLDKPGDIFENIRLAKPDVLLMDIYLGDRNGLDIVRQIRKMPEFDGIRIVMVSGVEKTDESLAAGADKFLLKPYMPNELFEILRS